jgi:hypothetical protein
MHCIVCQAKLNAKAQEPKPPPPEKPGNLFD